MPSYISSSANRFYTALERSYGELAEITAANRIPALKLSVRQQQTITARRDKTGSRSFSGLPPRGRRRTDFELRTLLTSWNKPGPGAQNGTSPELMDAPSYGPLFHAAMGGTPLAFPGGTAAGTTAAGQLTFQTAHGLTAGQAVAYNGEIRFAVALVDAQTVLLNAPFTNPPTPGSVLSATMTYVPGNQLPSVSIFDYWDPATSVQRLLLGVGVDQMSILVNGDYHEFLFSGVAQDVMDSSSVSSGPQPLESFPPEPAVEPFGYAVVPGNMGQAWLGVTPSRFFTLTGATVTLNNGLEMRSREFGSSTPLAIAPGERIVTTSFDLYCMDNSATQALYEAARQQSPISAMFQLGEAEGQLMGVHLKSVVPEVPEFDDRENRLQWRFRESRAQGTVDDEIAIAFA